MTVIGRRPDPVVASASPIEIDRGEATKPTSKDAGELWDMYRACGPVQYGVEFKAGAATKIRYYPARIAEEEEPDPNVPPVVQEVFDEFDEGFDGGLSAAMGQLVTQREVVGECAVVGNPNDVNWSIWSTSEWAKSNKQWESRGHRDSAGRITDDDYAFRVWRPDPEWREKAISSVRAASEDIALYLAAREVVQAVVWSTASAGIQGIPDAMLNNRADKEWPHLDEVAAGIIRAVSQVRGSRDAANRLVPTFVNGPADAIEAFANGHVDLTRDIPERALALMEQALRGIAVSMDLPAEILLGMGDINHWGQWFVDESARVNHVDPAVLALLRSLDTGYLHPMLEARGVPNAREYMIWRDFSDLTARQLTVEQAIAMYVEGVISGSAVRRIADLTEDDASTDDDPNPRRSAGSQVSTEVEVGLSERRDPPVTAAVSNMGAQLADIDRAAFVALAELAQAEIARATEKAANKLRSALQGVPDIAGQLRDLNGAALLAALSDDLSAAGLTETDLVPESTWQRLRARAAQILSGAVGAARGLFGRGEPDAEDIARAVDYLADSAHRRVGTLLEAVSTGTELVDVDAWDIWATLTYAAGATPSEVAGYRGITSSAVDWAQEDGYVVEARRWYVGNPPEPFEPHQALAGTVFSDWESPALDNAGAFPASAFYYPGDHRGCRCWVEPVLVPASELGT